MGIENSLAGALAQPAGARPGRPGGGAFVADHFFRFDLEERHDGGPAWRTDDDFGASPARTVDHGHCARRTGRDPKTVRKYIDRGLEPPVYGRRQVGRPNKLAPYVDYLRERIVAFPDLTAVRLARKSLGALAASDIISLFGARPERDFLDLAAQAGLNW